MVPSIPRSSVDGLNAVELDLCLLEVSTCSQQLWTGRILAYWVLVCRQGGGFAAQKLPVDAAPAAGPLNPTPTVAFGEFLCQRSQACFKAVNHTGFCSGHRGVKRNQDDDGTGTGKKRKTEPKRKGKSGRKAQADAMAAQLGLAPPPPHAGIFYLRCLPMPLCCDMLPCSMHQPASLASNHSSS